MTLAGAEKNGMVSNRASRGSRLVSLLALALAAAAPVAVWHDLIATMTEAFTLEAGYLVTAWSGFALIGVGILAFLPVALTSGTDPARRFYPRRRDTWLGWGMAMYVMGVVLVLQLAAISANG